MDEDYAETTPYMDALRELAEVKAERDKYRKALEVIAKSWQSTVEAVVEANTK